MSAVPTVILRQDTGTVEGRAVAQAAMLVDVPVVRTSIEGLAEHRDKFAVGALPVGSVEFVREAMRVAGFQEPASMTYPVELNELLGRRIDLMPVDRVRGTRFLKPTSTKLFTGFVWRESARDSDYNKHDLEQLQVLRSLPGSTLVWVAEPVRFVCEWRYYVLEGRAIGAARYDPDGADDADAPNPHVLQAAIEAMLKVPGAPAAYAVDLGVLDTGETVLVEVNDAWAIGLYGRSLEPRDYLRLLACRWRQISGAAAAIVPAVDGAASTSGKTQARRAALR